MITIISPAKNLEKRNQLITNQYTIPEFLKDAEILIDELRQLSPQDLAELMGVNKNIAEINYERFMRWTHQISTENAQQAIFMFNGHAYKTLKAETLDEKELEFAQQHVRILSGLYGILRPLDLIQPYRLEMGTHLNTERGENLYKFWNNKINRKINTTLQNQKNPTLINLASQEYFKAIKPESLEGNIITPVFKEKKNNEYKTIAVYAKKARGAMTRFIIKEKIENPEALKTFEEDGYVFNNELSSKKEWVFTR